jgi:mannose/fructose/N-acetylgalactosamine-specific phosphotransferase system component IIB
MARKISSVTIERRKHDNSRVFIVTTNLFDYVNSIELRHAQIEQCHVGPMSFPKIDRFTSVTSLPDNHHV